VPSPAASPVALAPTAGRVAATTAPAVLGGVGGGGGALGRRGAPGPPVEAGGEPNGSRVSRTLGGPFPDAKEAPTAALATKCGTGPRCRRRRL